MSEGSVNMPQQVSDTTIPGSTAALKFTTRNNLCSCINVHNDRETNTRSDREIEKYWLLLLDAFT